MSEDNGFIHLKQHDIKRTLNYIAENDQTHIIILWPTIEDEALQNVLITFLEQNGVVFSKSLIEFDYHSAKNLLYQIYHNHFVSDPDKASRFISNKLHYLRWQKFEKKESLFIVFNNANNLPILGHKAIFKEYLRDKCIQFYSRQYIGMRGDDFIHITDTHREATELAQIIFFKNSLNFLKQMKLDRYLSEKMSTSRQLLEEFCYFIKLKGKNLLSNELLLLGGSIYFSHGLRTISDIDFIIAAQNEPEKIKQLIEDVPEFLKNRVSPQHVILKTA